MISGGSKGVGSPCSVFHYPLIFPPCTLSSFLPFTFETTCPLVLDHDTWPFSCLSINVSAPHSFSPHSFPSALRNPILLRTQPTAFTPPPPTPPMFLCDLISPLLPLEQFDLNAELQLSQSRSSCGQPIRSRPFCFFIFRQGEEEESPQFLD